MMALRERLLLPVDAEEGRTARSFGEVAMLSRTQMLGLGIAFTVGVCASPYIMAGDAMPESVSDESAMELMATPESLGAVKKLYKPFKPFAPAIEFFGVFAFSLPFLIFGWTHAKDFSGFTGWLGSLGIPMPKIMAAGGVATLLVGPLLLLSRVDTLVCIGGDMMGIFIPVATYFGHIVPLRSAAKDSWPYMFNMFMLLKNVSLYGSLSFIGWISGANIKAFKPYAAIQLYLSLVVLSLGFLIPALMHISQFNNFVGWVGSLGLPIPAKAAAVSGIAMLLLGCGLLYTGCPLFVEVGAEVLLLFTLGATYYGHYKPMKAAEDATQKQEQFMLFVKNIGIMGGLLVVIGKSVKDI